MLRILNSDKTTLIKFTGMLVIVLGLHALFVLCLFVFKHNIPLQEKNILMQVHTIPLLSHSSVKISKTINGPQLVKKNIAKSVENNPDAAQPAKQLSVAPAVQHIPSVFPSAKITPTAIDISTDVKATEPAPATKAMIPAITTSAVRFDADYLQNPAPVYPAMSRKLQEEGKILLEVKVNVHGLADQVEIKQGSGFRRLDEAAVTTVRQWRFIPARRGDETIASSVVIPINFQLNK